MKTVEQIRRIVTATRSVTDKYPDTTIPGSVNYNSYINDCETLLSEIARLQAENKTLRDVER